jgi:hypothetical protein
VKLASPGILIPLLDFARGVVVIPVVRFRRKKDQKKPEISEIRTFISYFLPLVGGPLSVSPSRGEACNPFQKWKGDQGNRFFF